MNELERPDPGALLATLVEKLVGWLEIFVAMLPNLAVALLVVVGAWFLSRWIAQGAERLLLRLTRSRPISGLSATILRLSIMAAGIFVALGLLDLDKTVTSLLAGVGVIGLALGFAFQDIAANFMSGLIMALNRPFEFDDQVEIAGHLGRVREVALRATTIETLDGLSLLVPNKDVFQNPIVNYTKTARRRLEIGLGTAYKDSMERVAEVVKQAAADTPFRDRDVEVEVLFESFGASSIDSKVLVWLTRSDQMSYRKARSQAMQRIKQALDAAELTIPFPIRTLDFGADVVGGASLDVSKRSRADDGEHAEADDS